MILKILLLIFLSFSSPAYAKNWCDDVGAVACFFVDEGADETLQDESGNSNDGTFKDVGEPAWESMAGTAAPSYADYQLHYDNSDDVVNVVNFSDLDPFTVVIWINADTHDDATDAIFDKLETSSPYHHNFWIELKAGKLEVGLYSGTWRSYTQGEVTMTEEKWHHIAFAYDGAGDANLVVWIDGELKNDAGSYDVINSASDTTEIGRGNGNVFDGKTSEAAVFNTRLSIEDINDIMDNGLEQAAAPAARRISILN